MRIPRVVLQLMEVAKPEPKDDQVLVKVNAASVNALDYRRFQKISTMSRLMEERFIKSVGKALGADIAGRVEAVGASVKQFQPGDEVFGVAAGSKGGFAEYACAAENKLALKPANLSVEAAAAIPVAGLISLARPARQSADSTWAEGSNQVRAWVGRYADVYAGLQEAGRNLA